MAMVPTTVVAIRTWMLSIQGNSTLLSRMPDPTAESYTLCRKSAQFMQSLSAGSTGRFQIAYAIQRPQKITAIHTSSDTQAVGLVRAAHRACSSRNSG